MERRLRAEGFPHVAGVDEAGRGCLAGPVVAAAVIMPPGRRVPHVNDSKLLTAEQREELAAEVQARAVSWGVGVIQVDVIDSTNILKATYAAMHLALEQLDPPPDFVIADGYPIPGVRVPCRGVHGGDRRCYCVAAASILAKTHRDRLMVQLDALHPGYGLARNKGYGTRDHREAIQRLGPCAVHRMSFEPLRSLSQGTLEF